MAKIFMCVVYCICVRYEIRLKLVFLSSVAPFSHQIKCEISLHDEKNPTDASTFPCVCARVCVSTKRSEQMYLQINNIERKTGKKTGVPTHLATDTQTFKLNFTFRMFQAKKMLLFLYCFRFFVRKNIKAWLMTSCKHCKLIWTTSKKWTNAKKRWCWLLHEK